MFNIFKKKLDCIDVERLGVEVHSHLIPDVDDGVKTLGQSIEILKLMKGLGYRKVITTPHIMLDCYQNTPEDLLARCQKVKSEIKAQNIDLEFEVSAEYNIDDGILNKIKNDEILPFSGNKVLVEMPFFHEASQLDMVIWELQSRGYEVVLAHVERYEYWHDNWSRICEIKDKDVWFQLNLLSVLGGYGKPVQKMAKKLVDNNMIDLLGSDCHRMEHAKNMKEALSHPIIHKLFDSGRLQNHLL